MHAVETLGAELVVGKAAEEFGDHNVDKKLRLPRAHITFDHRDFVRPFCAVLTQQVDVSVGVFLDTHEADVPFCCFGGIAGAGDERATSGADDGYNTARVRNGIVACGTKWGLTLWNPAPGP